MPNGGPDCCGNCGFNRAVQEMAHPHPEQRDRFRDLSYCTLRDLPITNPFWTYCQNFRYGSRLPKPGEKEELRGWIQSSGLYEGYVRIPWHGEIEPSVSVPATCEICSRTTPKGIRIHHEGRDLGFCTNRHYVEWWKTLHDDPALSAERYARPEEFLKEMGEEEGDTRDSVAGLVVVPHQDSEEMAERCRRALDMDRPRAAKLGHSAVQFSRMGFYETANGARVDWSGAVEDAIQAKVSIPPDKKLAEGDGKNFPETRVQVTNETTLMAARRLHEAGKKPIALNFANGIQPGGGFLNGARAQEEVLCRSSALFVTLEEDPMYESHAARSVAESSDWAIYSPNVPVFRNDEGVELEEPWLLSFLTCAAPYAPAVGQPESGDLLQRRIHRVLAIMKSFGYEAVVLGAWGCGAFHNDPTRTARDFREALEHRFCGAFSDVVFAIADWSPERRFLGPFRDVFGASG